MTPQDLEKFKTTLLKTKAYLEEELGHHPMVTNMGTDVEGRSYDEEADQAEELTVNNATRLSLKQRLGAVNDALRKIDQGGYGRCEKCRGEIGMDVLEADPESWYCKQCKNGR